MKLTDSPLQGQASFGNRQSQRRGWKICPFCAERVRFEALKCRYCAEFFLPGSPQKVRMAGTAPQGFKLSVVIPVFNEESTLEALLKAVAKVPLCKEIILVDDGSTDGSREKLRHWQCSGFVSLLPEEPEWETDFRLLLHSRNRGKGSALKTGFKATSGDAVLIQDADLEYDPAEYLRLLKPIWEDKADVVYGSRFLGQSHRVLYFWHSAGNRFLTTLSNMLTDLNLTDMETCYKVFRREVIQSLDIEEERFGFEPEMTAKIAKMGACIFEVPISYRGRTYAEGKKITWRDGIRAIYCILKYNLKGS